MMGTAGSSLLLVVEGEEEEGCRVKLAVAREGGLGLGQVLEGMKRGGKGLLKVEVAEEVEVEAEVSASPLFSSAATSDEGVGKSRSLMGLNFSCTRSSKTSRGSRPTRARAILPA